jgi:hypothetical protein
MVTHKTYKKDIQPFILNQLKDLQNKNSDNGESNHRIIAVYNLQCFLYDVGKPICGKLGMKTVLFNMVNNHFVCTVTENPLCWFACISYLTNPKNGKNRENERTRLSFAKECFFKFYGYQNLSEEEKKIKLSEYKGFVLATEIEEIMKFFQTDVNVFTYHDKESCYSKRHSYVCSNKAIFSLNVGLLDLPRYQHAVWLENVDNVCNCFACSKCQMRVFHNPNAFQRHIHSCGGKVKDKQLTVSRTEDIIDPYFAGDANVKYLTCQTKWTSSSQLNIISYMTLKLWKNLLIIRRKIQQLN